MHLSEEASLDAGLQDPQQQQLLERTGDQPIRRKPWWARSMAPLPRFTDQTAYTPV